MKKITTIVMVLASAVISAVTFSAAAHERFMLPSHTLLSGDKGQYVTLTASISNDIFLSLFFFHPYTHHPSILIPQTVNSLKHQAWKPGPKGVVYLVNNNKLAWEDAKQFCEKRSGKLAIITNEHVRDSLKDLLRNEERALYWTGSVFNNFFGKKNKKTMLVFGQCLNGYHL